MFRSVPVINTARLTLRPFRPEDFDAYADLWSDAQVVGDIGVPPRSRGEAWMAFLANSGHWQMTGFGQWAVTDARTRRVIGQVGFFYGTRDLGEDFDPHPEAGWALIPEAQGKGLGREAVAAAHGWFDRVMSGPLVALVCLPNARSRHLAAAMGYGEVRQVPMGAQGAEAVLCKRARPPQ